MAKSKKQNYKDKDHLFQDKQKIDEVLNLLQEVEDKKRVFKGDVGFENSKKKDEVRQIISFFEMFDTDDNISFAKALKTILVKKQEKLAEDINDIYSMKNDNLSTVDLFEQSPLSF